MTDDERVFRAAIEEGLAELRAVGEHDDWAEALVQTSAWLHVDLSPDCTGWTMASSGRAVCGLCEWQCSARMTDAGEVRSARFVLFALAAIGGIVTSADMLLHAKAEKINAAGVIKARVEGHEILLTDDSGLRQIAITHTVKI